MVKFFKKVKKKLKKLFDYVIDVNEKYFEFKQKNPEIYWDEEMKRL